MPGQRRLSDAFRTTPRGENEKGCGIGYALAADSYEGVSGVDARTVAAPDAITAFAVPNPRLFLAGQSVFSGLVAQRVASPSGSPSLLWIGQCYLNQPFQLPAVFHVSPPESGLQ